MNKVSIITFIIWISIYFLSLLYYLIFYKPKWNKKYNKINSLEISQNSWEKFWFDNYISPCGWIFIWLFLLFPIMGIVILLEKIQIV